jgi:entry exclusion lipoprotein TrbK
MIIKELILARAGGKGNTAIVVIVAALLCALAYKNLTKVSAPPPATKNNCTSEAIRKVADPMERAILSGRCAKQSSTTAAKAD